METVEVVIRLPKDVYNNAVNDLLCGNELLVFAVRDGTVLPKGHGRLIDADAILEDPFGNTYKDIDIAETIIEADKGV